MPAISREQRAVATASREQVRRPLYASSVGRWKNYRGHLADLIGELEPQGVGLPPLNNALVMQVYLPLKVGKPTRKLRNNQPLPPSPTSSRTFAHLLASPNIPGNSGKMGHDPFWIGA